MKEYTKNKNEYFLDGKLYVERIKSCEVEEKLIVLYKHKAGNKYDFVNEIYLKGEVPSHKASWGQSLRGMQAAVGVSRRVYHPACEGGHRH